MCVKIKTLSIIAILCVFLSTEAFSKDSSKGDGHVIELNGPIVSAEDGLLLGNGDLSASIYQNADQIIWRLGKGDVWDRRIDRSDDSKPAHIDEVANGIEVEGWKCEAYQSAASVKATRGTKKPGPDEGNLPGLPAELRPASVPLSEARRRIGFAFSCRFAGCEDASTRVH